MLAYPILLLLWGLSPLAAQYRPPILGPGGQPVPEARPAAPSARPRPPRPNAPAPGEQAVVRAVVQDAEGPWWRLRGQAEIETHDALFKADEIDYNRETGVLEARGHVFYQSFEDGSEFRCERLDYNLKSQTGTYYSVEGTFPAKIDPRPGVLTTGNPFAFRGRYAERQQQRYLLYDGVITNCDPKKPAWKLEAAKFDIIPEDRAIAYKSVMKLQGVPILYVPAFYKSMAERPRKSGFLTPSFGNSSRRGQMIGVGYYWAISRSYDVQYRAQYFTARGVAHNVEFRGKPTRRSDFDALVYGVQDKGLRRPDGSRVPEGGFLFSLNGRADLGRGFYARGVVNYLSSFTFRQAFTETFNEAVFSEVNSVGFVSKDWSSFHLNTLFTRQQNFTDPFGNESIVVRRLPQVEFISRDRALGKELPIWVSWQSSAGLVRRNQALFQTRQSVERLDAEPRIMTAVRWKDLHLVPAFSLRETYYGSSFRDGRVTGEGLLRSSREFTLDLILPGLARVFDAPRWLGEKMKHVVEPRATFRHVGGVRNFDRLIRFDETELLANTNEVEFLVANRVLTKRRDGLIRDALHWELSQRRFFSPTFGGALVPGARNVFLSSTAMSAYTFLDRARRESPLVSVLRLLPRDGFGVDWRIDWDPLRSQVVNNSFSFDARKDQYFLSVGHSYVACIPLQTLVSDGENVAVTPCGMERPPQGSILTPSANQFRGMIGLGQENKRGWNGAFLAIYDYTSNVMQFGNTQITYNTNCCAYSVQYRRFGFGARNENQFRVAFVIANIGSFGTLRRQERLF